MKATTAATFVLGTALGFAAGTLPTRTSPTPGGHHSATPPIVDSVILLNDTGPEYRQEFTPKTMIRNPDGSYRVYIRRD